jgi:autotransporter-associated beta strand protein
LETLGSYTTAKTMTLGAAGTINTNANTNRFDGLLSGPFSLTKTGAGTLILNGVNGYTDGTLLNAGTITVGNNSALGTGRLTVANATTLTAGVDGLALANAIATLGAGTVNTQAFTFTLNGNIGGTGSIAKIGSGNLIMAGNNSYAGGTNLNTGSLTVTNNNSIGTGALNTTGGTTIIVGTVTGANTAVTLANAVVLGAGTTTVNLQGTSLVFNNDASIVTDGAALTLNGVVSGAGALATGNFGTLTLNGDNSYSGGLLINTRSVVYVGSDTAVGTGTVTTSGATGLYNISGAARTLANAFVLNGGTWMGGTSNMVLNGTITGAGFVIKAGAQTLTLNNANSFTGTSQLRDGRITVGTGTALGTGALTVFAPTVPLAPVAGLATTLAAGTSGLTLANNVTLSTGSNLIVESGTGSFTLAGVISGAGGLTKTQSGNLILNGGNSFSGGTLLNAGRITVGTSTALGTGRLTMAGGTTLASGAADLVLANAITALGAGTIDTAANILTLNGVIDGAGSLAKTGVGALTLTGANTYTGGTALNAGTIQVNTNTALGTGGLVMADGTTLLAGLNGLALGNAITLVGTSTVNTQAFSFTLNGVIGGAGTLAKTGTGTLVLNGSNGFTGGTALNAGTIRVGNSLALGTGNLAMAAGTFLQAGAPLLTIANTISMAGGATVDVVGQTLTLGGVISGTGPLSVIDSAANPASDLTLTGVNTYTGGTVVTGTQVRVSQDANLGNAAGSITLNGGTLWTTASFASARAVTLGTGGGTARVAPGTVLTLTGVVGGTALTKIGGGTLALNAANTHAGGTALNAGTLTVGNNSGLGTGVLTMADATTLSAGVTGLTVANNIAVLGAATVNSGASPSVFTLAGVISGAGSVIKQATGILTLTGASTYTGATTVAVGTLNVTGSLVSAVSVNSGAALNGTGTVGALNVLAGGSVNPGAPGTADRATLTVTGAATLNGTYTANIASNDRISAGGALTLGGTLAVVPVVPGGFTQFNTVYTVASGSTRTGTFATTTGLDQFGIAFNPLVEYTATQANIRLAPQSLVTLGNRFGGISGNPLEVALAFDRAVAAGYNPQAFFAVYANAGSNLPRTLREMSGEQRATERRVVLDTNRVFRETALDRLNLGMSSMAGQQVSTSDGDRSLTIWLRGAGSWGKAQTNGAATSFQTAQVGLLTGIDWSRDALTVGGMFHFTTTDVEFGVLGGSSRVETVGGTIYGGYRKDSGLVANGGISVSSARANGSRAITLAGFSQSLAGRTTGTTYQFFGELAWDLAGSADTRIEPFARMTLVKANMNGLTETGGVAALTAAKQNYDITVTNLGMRFGTNVADGKVALNVSAAWQGTTGDRDAATIIGISAVGQNGNIRSVLIDRSALVLQGGMDL